MRTTPLPGIGVQYDLVTLEGHHLSVVAHCDGSRSLNGYRADDPDACALSVHLSEPEAGALTDHASADPGDSMACSSDSSH